MKLTDNEKIVIKAYKKDDFVSYQGWDSLHAGTWSDGFAETITDLANVSVPGVIASLCKKGIMVSNGENISLTENGIEVAATV